MPMVSIGVTLKRVYLKNGLNRTKRIQMKTYKPMTNGDVYKKLDDVLLSDGFVAIFKSPWMYKGLTTADIDFLLDLVHTAGHDLPTGYVIPSKIKNKKSTKGTVKCVKRKMPVKKAKVLVGSVLRSVKPSSTVSTPVTKAKVGVKKPTRSVVMCAEVSSPKKKSKK